MGCKYGKEGEFNMKLHGVQKRQRGMQNKAPWDLKQLNRRPNEATWSSNTEVENELKLHEIQKASKKNAK